MHIFPDTCTYTVKRLRHSVLVSILDRRRSIIMIKSNNSLAASYYALLRTRPTRMVYFYPSGDGIVPHGPVLFAVRFRFFDSFSSTRFKTSCRLLLQITDNSTPTKYESKWSSATARNRNDTTPSLPNTLIAKNRRKWLSNFFENSARRRPDARTLKRINVDRWKSRVDMSGWSIRHIASN